MIVWNTQVPILPSRSVDDLYKVSRKWLVGSPHSTWTQENFREISNGDLVRFKNGNQSVLAAKYTGPEGDFVGFRHEWKDEGSRNWTTEICGWHTTQKFLVGVQLSCEVGEIGSEIPQPKKPYVVRQLLEDLGGDLDVTFEVGDRPIVLGENDVDLAIRLLRCDTDTYLPVVYVSSTWRNEPAFNANNLAQWLSGMAHVVVEPSRRFSYILADRIERENPYEGAVSICWPGKANKQTRLFPYHFDSPHEYASVIVDKVRLALAGTRPNFRCTWSYIRELVFSQRIKELRSQGTAGLDEYVAAFDGELNATKARLESAELEVIRLRSELGRANAVKFAARDGLLTEGREQDLFPGEQRDIVLNALESMRKGVLEDGRVSHVLSDLLRANKPTGEAEKLKKQIRAAVAGGDNAGIREQRALEALGFEITQDGKHYKLVFRGDDRYTFAMAKSGSDWRGVKNWTSDVLRQLFQ